MLSSNFFCAKMLKITIFSKILKNVAKFLKDSIFRAEVFSKLSFGILIKLRCHFTSSMIYLD